MNSERWRCLWMNRTPWCGGLDEQDDPVEGWMNSRRWRGARGGRLNRTPWMNSRMWRLEEVNGG